MLVAAVAFLASSGSAFAAESAELIVRFESGTSKEERAEIREEAGTVLDTNLPLRMQLVDVELDQTRKEARNSLESDPSVMYAEPNVIRQAFLRPDDPMFPMLWGMENTGQTVRGLAGTADADSDTADAWDAIIGAGPVVAVVDSGVELSHPDLAPNVWSNPGESGSGRESNGFDDDLNGKVDDAHGWDFVGDDGNPADENGHGTHVAGTIAARRGNGLGVAGVADGSRLMALRVLDAQGSGSVSDVVLAYAYAFKQGAKVVNLSLGSSSSSRAERDAIAAFPQMLFVAAAGNGGADGVGDDNDLDAQYPCAYVLPNVVCVAASDNRDRLAPFSNFGRLSVHLAAPGASIASTWTGGGYGWASGTSMATPHVSGAAALMWAANPGAPTADIRSGLLAGVDPGQEFSGRTVTGGRLNVLNSLRRIANVTFATPPAPTSPASDSDDGPGSGERSGAGITGGDRVAPRVSLRLAHRQRLRRVLRRGVAVRLSCSEACSVRLRLRIGGRLVARTAPASIAPGAAKRIVARVRRSALRGARPRRATLVVRATDGAGNTREVTARIVLRR